MTGNYHHWTTKDLALIRRHYGRKAPEPLPPAELARLRQAIADALPAILDAGVRARLQGALASPEAT